MDKNNFKDMWVYVEHDGKNVHPVALELCCEVRKLCDKSGDRLVAVVAGQLPQTEIEKLEACGVDGLILVSGTGYERYNTEAYTNAPVFNLAGQRVNGNFKGVVIKNGKKFMNR